MKAVDNKGNSYEIHNDGELYFINKDSIKNDLEYIDISDDSLCAKTGDRGYYVIADFNKKGSRLCYFNNKKDNERICKQDLLPIVGINKNNESKLIIAHGYKYEFYVVFGVKNGKYYLKLRFMLHNIKPYENISVKIIKLKENATYSDMAVAYRNYRLNNKECIPISERVKNREELLYAVKSPEIRIRMGWKPAPPEILEQTKENEPIMKVACTFKRVKDIIDELERQNVKKAEICLVGFNKSGHDGRWPDIFPIEEKLGGEKELKELIDYGRKKGYNIVCHTNSTDCYSISERFSKDIVAKNQDGSLSINWTSWSGGRMYHLSPDVALKYAKTDLPKLKKFGFKGLHYIDVLGIVPPVWNFDENNFITPEETVKYYVEIMKMCKELFGGFASEGAFDFTAPYIDYGFYVSWDSVFDEMVDKTVPLWQIVYHGIILYNSTTGTVNYTVKDKKYHMQVIEEGARPSFYFYSKFIEGAQKDWLGKEDLTCDTDKELKESVSAIKKAYDEYEKLNYLQQCFIEEHKEVSENIYETRYSDGTVIKVDYNNFKYYIKNT